MRHKTWLGLWMLLLVTGGGGSIASAMPQELIMQEISYTTSDDVTIHGSWVVAARDDDDVPERPVVILLHDYGIDRRDWGIFIPDLIHNGYHVLAIDLRGHGQSRLSGARLSGTLASSGASSLLRTGHLDVEGALEWLKNQDEADTKHVYVVGVGLGADLAYLCSGKFTQKIRASVAISPTFLSVTESGISNFRPRAMLFCASSKDSKGASMAAASSLANFTDDPKKVLIYESTAHGLAMFYKHPEMTSEILGWLK